MVGKYIDGKLEGDSREDVEEVEGREGIDAWKSEEVDSSVSDTEESVGRIDLETKQAVTQKYMSQHVYYAWANMIYYLDYSWLKFLNLFGQ